jgi:PPOX class probable F420-dependent enzyme
MNLDVDVMRDLVVNARVARLATVRGDGRPHVVPVCFALDGERIVSVVDDKPKRSTELLRLDNVRAHPAVSFLVDRYDDDWTRLWWVRVDGRATVVSDGPDHARAIERLAEKYPPYRERRPSGAVLVIEADGWRGWSASSL